MTVTDLNELAEHIDQEVKEALRLPALDAGRALANEVGLRRARGAVAAGPDLIAAAQDAYRNAQAKEREAKDSYDGALIEAEWELDAQFHTEGNRVYLRIECDECDGRGKVGTDADTAKCERCDGIGSARKSMTADERKAWKAAEAAKLPVVKAAAINLRAAEEHTASARDGIEVARTRISAARHELEAAIAELGVLSLSLGSKRKGAEL